MIMSVGRLFNPKNFRPIEWILSAKAVAPMRCLEEPEWVVCVNWIKSGLRQRIR